MLPSSGQLSRWLLAKYLSSRSRSLAVMPLVSTAVETRRLDIHTAGSCRCSFESVLLGERPAAPAQHSSRTGLSRQPGGGLFVGSMGLCSQPHHAASVWPCQGRTTLLERTREPFIDFRAMHLHNCHSSLQSVNPQSHVITFCARQVLSWQVHHFPDFRPSTCFVGKAVTPWGN